MTRRAGLRRGEVYLVNFDPTVGSEIRKTRPALVIQNDVSNRSSDVTIVAAITSRFDPTDLYPNETLVKAGEAGLKADSVVLSNQIRSVDKQRLGRRLGRVKPQTMEQLDQALAISVGLLKPPNN